MEDNNTLPEGLRGPTGPQGLPGPTGPTLPEAEILLLLLDLETVRPPKPKPSWLTRFLTSLSPKKGALPDIT